MEQQNGSRTLLRGLDILHAVSSVPEPTLTQIARATGLAKSTTSRFLSVLVQEGYLRIDGEQRYRLAPRMLELGFSALRGLGVSELLMPPLQDIADLCKGAANIGELVGPDVIMIARRTSRDQRERFYSMNINIGTKLPALTTATGRALLALDDTHLEEALEQRRVNRSATGQPNDEKEVRAHLKQVRKDGVARVRGQLAPGFGAVAIPLRVSATRVVAFSGSYLLADHGPDIENQVERLLRERSQGVLELLQASDGVPPRTEPKEKR
ncbi:IclR family transcriptional regulator [Piscinibacter sp.]|uniref:IclR family transcriptional regulator n=1 Tax=Piscinibacter sp. TaxID=1903157 RepID=UPI0035B2EBC8